MKDKKHDIIVVGAGPVGSYTACLLAREGLDVGIFERNASVGEDVNCTGIVSAECIGNLHLPEGIIMRQIDSIRAVSPSGNCLRYHSASPLAYIVNRSLFDRQMNAMAEREGATTYLNARVEEVEITGGAFKVRLKEAETKTEFNSRIGVVATGFELNSLSGLPVGKKPMNFLFGIQTDVTMDDIGDIEVYFGEDVAPGSFAWVVPTNGKSAKAGLIVKKDPANFMKKFLRNPLIARRLTDCGNRMRCSPIPMKRIPKSYADRLVVVGEAAGQVKATTGGGIYFGLLCAEIAAGSIVKAFRCGDYSGNVLKEYEIEWRKKIEPELKAGVMLRNIFSKISDRQIDILMDLAKKDGIMPLVEKAHFDWHKDLVSHLVRHLISKILPGN
jgi:digeranylgeranylglycerophospholipid reductase